MIIRYSTSVITLLYYKYVPIADPVKEADEHRALCKSLGLKGRVLIGSEGINGTCSGPADAIAKYKEAMAKHPLFSDVAFKEWETDAFTFEKMFVRVRQEVVTLRSDVKLENKAPYVSPAGLHEELERGEDLVLIDMRNEYEAKIGKFRNAVVLPMENFRDLPTLLPKLEAYKDKKVVTYCTGGIRCEKASALLRQSGFENVRQLEGGIIKYCEAFPDGHFEGSCFVFDRRLRVRYQGKNPPKYLTDCEFCATPCDAYRDCADDACHALYICCDACHAKHGGLCTAHPVAVAA